MTSDFDVSQYLGIFLDEAEEQIQVLDESIVLLEHDKENMDLINKIFRAAHTLKGSSASMGFDKIAHLTHAMESVLDRLRHKELALSTDIVNLLLESLDNLQLLKEEIVSGQEGESDASDLISKLKQVARGVAVEAPFSEPKQSQIAVNSLVFDDVETNVIQAAEIKGFNVWHIVVKLVSDCLMKAARAYIVFNNLRDVGEVIKTIPPVPDIEEEKFENQFEILLVSREDADTISNIIKSISEIDQVTIAPVTIEGTNTSQYTSQENDRLD